MLTPLLHASTRWWKARGELRSRVYRPRETRETRETRFTNKAREMRASDVTPRNGVRRGESTITSKRGCLRFTASLGRASNAS